MPQPGIDHLARIPTIVLDPGHAHKSASPRTLHGGQGISAPGTVYRMDEVPLPCGRAEVAVPDGRGVYSTFGGRWAKPAWQPTRRRLCTMAGHHKLVQEAKSCKRKSLS